jgi:hypothetical protein
MEENPNYEYFEKGSFDISEQLIKEQGSEVCRNIIDKYYINVKSKDYDFGFIYKTPVAQIGQARSKRNLKYNICVFLCVGHFTRCRTIDFNIKTQYNRFWNNIH